MTRNPKDIELAQHIERMLSHILIDRQENVVTVEDADGNQYLITVQSIFTAGETRPLPDPDEAQTKESQPGHSE